MHRSRFIIVRSYGYKSWYGCSRNFKYIIHLQMYLVGTFEALKRHPKLQEGRFRPTAQPPWRAFFQAMKTHTALQSLALWPREALLHEVGKKGKVQTRAWHRCILSSVDEWTCVFSGWLTSDTHRCAYTTNRMCIQRWFHTSQAAQTCNWTATSKE